jgi:molybdopterin-guanine dinucleotide biosynthesis protein A
MAKITPNNGINSNDIVAYILAGGESRRFDHKIKGLQLLNGEPLIQHVIHRLKPQVKIININSHIQEYSQFGYDLISDTGAFFQGPLSGLLACMRHHNENHQNSQWLMISPCDSPFIPNDLVTHLCRDIGNDKDAGNDKNAIQASCIQYQGSLQPPFSLWHKSLLPSLENAVIKEQWGGLKIFLKSLGNAANVIEYPLQANNPFFNINCSDELQQAERFNHE